MAGESPLKKAAAALTAADIAEHARRHRPPANWKKWAHCPKAELWQCVALSFGFEPDETTMRAVLGGFVVAVGPKPRLWFAEHTELRKRLEIALANAGSDSLSRLHPLPNQSGDMASRLFSTAEFGEWARDIWPATVPAAFPGQRQASTLPKMESLHDLEMKSLDVDEVVMGRPRTPVTATETSSSLRTDDVCTAFDGIGMSSLEWRVALTKNRQRWAMACSESLGRPGATPAQGTWCPLKIAKALVTGKSRRAGVVGVAALDAAFKRRTHLRPFAEAWASLRADNPSWGE